MRQSLLLLFASVYYTVENLCVERRKLFDKRQSERSENSALSEYPDSSVIPPKKTDV